MPGWRDIPALVRHTTLAIYSKNGGGGEEGFIRALKMARGGLAKAGYIDHGSPSQIIEGIRLTGKGWVRNLKHTAEGLSGGGKDLTFANLFQMVEPKIYELENGRPREQPKLREPEEERVVAETAPPADTRRSWPSARRG